MSLNSLGQVITPSAFYHPTALFKEAVEPNPTQSTLRDLMHSGTEHTLDVVYKTLRVVLGSLTSTQPRCNSDLPTNIINCEHYLYPLLKLTTLLWTAWFLTIAHLLLQVRS